MTCLLYLLPFRLFCVHTHKQDLAIHALSLRSHTRDLCHLLLGTIVFGFWLFRAVTLPDLKATLQSANPARKGLGGETVKM